MKTFCEECRDFVSYQIIEIDRTKEIKGKNIRFKEKVAHCTECNSEMFVSELRDENLAAMDGAFRTSEGLISVTEIIEIIEKYDIGKRPLSLLLGWGETTLTRFVNGDLPSKTYSEQLKRINESPEAFLSLLVANQHVITDVAYKKSYEAINRIISEGKTCIVTNKIDSACHYIITRSVDITPLALQKLLYFAQGFHKVFAGSYIFTEDCEAWVHGPVYRDVYFKFKNHGYNPIDDSIKQFECFDLSQSEIEVIDAVMNYFGCYSGKILETMTHIEKPWKETRMGISEGDASNRVISKQLIEKYFNQVYKKYSMLNTADIKEYSDDLFAKIRH